MLDEEVQLPGQLLDIERDSIRKVCRALQFRPAPLKRRDQADGLSIERRVFGSRRGAEVGLERHVAEILERQHANVVGVPEDARNGHRHLLEQPGDVHEGQRVEVERLGVQRQHNRGCVRQQHAKIATIRGIAGQRHNPRRARCETAALEVGVDPIPLVAGVGLSLFEGRRHDVYRFL